MHSYTEGDLCGGLRGEQAREGTKGTVDNPGTKQCTQLDWRHLSSSALPGPGSGISRGVGALSLDRATAGQGLLATPRLWPESLEAAPAL